MYRITIVEQGQQKWWKKIYSKEQEAQKAVLQLRNIKVNAWYYSITAKLEKAKRNLVRAGEINKQIATRQLQTEIQMVTF